MKTKMLSDNAQKIYRERKQIVEFVFGDLKENKGIVTFLTRSLKTVKTEFNLMSIASNLYKIWKKKREKININFTNFVQFIKNCSSTILQM